MHLGDLTGVSQEEARRWRRVALVLFLIAGLGGPAGQTVDAAQPTEQSVPDGFVPMDDVPAEEQLPAAPLLAAAYIVVWVLAIGYLWTIWRRLGSVEKELAEALRRVGETDGA